MLVITNVSRDWTCACTSYESWCCCRKSPPTISSAGSIADHIRVYSLPSHACVCAYGLKDQPSSTQPFHSLRPQDSIRTAHLLHTLYIQANSTPILSNQNTALNTWYVKSEVNPVTTSSSQMSKENHMINNQNTECSTVLPHSVLYSTTQKSK